MTCFDRLTTIPSPLHFPRLHSRALPSAIASGRARRGLARPAGTALILGLLLAAAPAGATSFVPMTDAALADQAPLIVAGRIAAIDQAPVIGRPATDYTVSPDAGAQGHRAGRPADRAGAGGRRPRRAPTTGSGARHASSPATG